MPAGKFKEKNLKKKYFFCILKVTEERSRIQSWIGIGIRIRIKMSWIPNTASHRFIYSFIILGQRPN
jgi:hypothetical protein